MKEAGVVTELLFGEGFGKFSVGLGFYEVEIVGSEMMQSLHILAMINHRRRILLLIQHIH